MMNDDTNRVALTRSDVSLKVEQTPTQGARVRIKFGQGKWTDIRIPHDAVEGAIAAFDLAAITLKVWRGDG